MKFLISLLLPLLLPVFAYAADNATAPRDVHMNCSSPQGCVETKKETPVADTIKPFPKDVVIAYLKPCINDHKEMIEPCKCMIKQMQSTMTLKQFVEMSKLPDPTEDRRFATIANRCLPKAQ